MTLIDLIVSKAKVKWPECQIIESDCGSKFLCREGMKSVQIGVYGIDEVKEEHMESIADAFASAITWEESK